MIDPLSLKIAKNAHVDLEELIPGAGEPLGFWWTVIKPGTSKISYWFWGNKALPDGTILKMTGGPLFAIDKYAIKALSEEEPL